MTTFGFLGEGARVYDEQLSVFLKPEMIHIGALARVDSHQKWEGGRGIRIGAGCHISSFVHLNIGGGILIVGDNVAITSGAKIVTGSNTMAGQAMSSAAPQEMQVIKRSTVTIGDFAIVAVNAVVLPGVKIGRYAVVAACALATRDVPDYAVVMGIPARIVGDRRDMEGWNYA